MGESLPAATVLLQCVAQMSKSDAEIPDRGRDRDVLCPFVRDTLLCLEGALRTMELYDSSWDRIEEELMALIDVVLAEHAASLSTVLPPNFVSTMERVVAARRATQLADQRVKWVASECAIYDRLLERFRELLDSARAAEGAALGV